jgi:hypothetical protein
MRFFRVQPCYPGTDRESCLLWVVAEEVIIEKPLVLDSLLMGRWGYFCRDTKEKSQVLARAEAC